MAKPIESTVNVISPDGEVGSISTADLETAQSQGYRVESDEERSARIEKEAYGDRPVAAVAAGIARGATFGLSDPLLEKTGLVQKSTIEGLQKHNEGASVTGELIGAVAPALIPGGQFTAAGAAARAGVAAERAIAGAAGGALRKVAASAAAGALEGSLYGAGQLVTEEMLGDSKVTGQKAAATLGMSTILGGGGGAVAKGLGLGAGRLFKRAGGLGDDVARAADDAIPGNVADDVLPDSAVADGAAAAAPDGAPNSVTGDPALPPSSGWTSEGIPGVGAVDENIGARARVKLEGAAEENTGLVKKVMEDLGLDFPKAEQWVLRDLDLTGSMASKLDNSAFEGLGESAPLALLNDKRYAKAIKLDEKLGLIRTKREEAAREIGEAVKAFDAVATPATSPNYPDMVNSIRGLADEAEQFGSILDDGTVRKLRKFAERLEHKPNFTFEDTEKLKRSLDPHLGWDGAPGPLKAKLQQVRGIINSEIERKAAALAQQQKNPGLFEKWKSAKEIYAGMSQLEPMVAKRAEAREVGNRLFSLTDNMAGMTALAAGGLNPLGLVAGAGAALLNKWARERLPHLVALKMHKMRTTPGSSTAAKGFGSFFNKLRKQADEATPTPAQVGAAGEAAGAATAGAVKETGVEAAREAATGAAEAGAAVAGGAPSAGSATTALAPYMGVLTSAAAKGPNVLFATHASLSEADPNYRQAMEKAGLKYEGGDSRQKARDVEALEKKLDAQNKRLEKALDSFLKNGSPMASRNLGALERLRINANGAVTKSRVEAAKARSKELSDLMANPNALTERLAETAGSAGDVAPGANMELMATAQRAVAFLHDKAPKPPTSPLDIPALRRPWMPNDASVSRFERYAAAVDDPYSVTEAMAGGHVTREAVEALKAVYPELYEETKQTILERLATHDSSLGYSQRIQLGLMLGVPTDESMQPERIAALQASFAVPEPETQGTRIGKPSGGASKVAQATMTDTERLQTRRSS